MALNGSFAPPGDKSISHRIGLFSLLARGAVRVRYLSTGRDCASTLAAVEALGGGVDRRDAEIVLRGAAGALVPEATIDCGNSGTTMRLLMGILATRPGRYRLTGDASLQRRPMERVAAPLRRMGARVTCDAGRPPVTIAGGSLQGADHELPVASAQLKTALLLAGLAAAGETRVREPHPSRDHSERLLRHWGADLAEQGGALVVRPSTLHLPATFTVPGDPSAAAFLLVAAALEPESRVTAEGIMLNPTRTGFLRVMERMGARLTVEELGRDPEPWGRVTVATSPELKAATIAGTELPSLVDEVPILALLATQARGTTVFADAGELRLKETDRLGAVVAELGALGARLAVEGDDLLVHGPTPLRPAPVLDSHGDHRIAMTLAVAQRLAGRKAAARDVEASDAAFGDATIRGTDCVAISYPEFFATLARLARGDEK